MRNRATHDLRQLRALDHVAALDGIAERRFIVAGLFSAKAKDFADIVDDLVHAITGRGGLVVATFVQRRGVSAGGRSVMNQPLSQRTLMSAGKIGEVADACRAMRPDAVVFVNPLSEQQARVLSVLFGCPAVGGGAVALGL